jgi:hypothetical protein
MTLKLVHSADTVAIELAATLREQVTQMAAEVSDDTTLVVSLLVHSDGISIRAMGEDISAYELMGLFGAAKLRVFADDVIED